VLDVGSYVHANSIKMMIVIAIGTALPGIASSRFRMSRDIALAERGPGHSSSHKMEAAATS